MDERMGVEEELTLFNLFDKDRNILLLEHNKDIMKRIVEGQSLYQKEKKSKYNTSKVNVTIYIK